MRFKKVVVKWNKSYASEKKNKYKDLSSVVKKILIYRPKKKNTTNFPSLTPCRLQACLFFQCTAVLADIRFLKHIGKKSTLESAQPRDILLEKRKNGKILFVSL